MYFHSVLSWLEKNIRKPYLEDTVVDKYVALPLKELYCNTKRQH